MVGRGGLLPERVFQELSDAGGSSSRRPRSSCEIVGSLEFLESFREGRPLDPPKRRKEVRIDPPVPLEDMPWSMYAPVVSDRFRAFLEEHAAGHAQYFEVILKGPKKLIPGQAYFLVNWLHVVDCIDFERSDWYEEDEEGDEPRYDFNEIVLDPSRVPPGVRIFRLRHFDVVTAIDADLAREIKRTGITGPQFYPIE